MAFVMHSPLVEGRLPRHPLVSLPGQTPKQTPLPVRSTGSGSCGAKPLSIAQEHCRSWPRTFQAAHEILPATIADPRGFRVRLVPSRRPRISWASRAHLQAPINPMSPPNPRATLQAVAEGKNVDHVQIESQDAPAVDAIQTVIGTRLEVTRAQAMGLTLSPSGSIWINAFRRARKDQTIFAVGDCAHKQDFFPRKGSHTIIASQAAAGGRIAGMKRYGIRKLRHNADSLSVHASQIGRVAPPLHIASSAHRPGRAPMLTCTAIYPAHPALPGTGGVTRAQYLPGLPRPTETATTQRIIYRSTRVHAVDCCERRPALTVSEARAKRRAPSLERST